MAKSRPESEEWRQMTVDREKLVNADALKPRGEAFFLLTAYGSTRPLAPIFEGRTHRPVHSQYPQHILGNVVKIKIFSKVQFFVLN